MDPRLVDYYNKELHHLRDMGGEFARQFPKIAARLGMDKDGGEPTDPYVERIMESAAYLAARIQLKLDAEFPAFTQRLLEIVYPEYLAPTPSMLVVELQPNLMDGNLATGVRVPRGSLMRSPVGRDDSTPCQFRTAQDVTLWPIRIEEAEYFSYAPDLPLTTIRGGQRVRGGLRLRLRATAGMNFNQIGLDALRLHFTGPDEIAYKLHELCLGSCIGVLAAPWEKPWPWYESLSGDSVVPVGLGDEHALLPVTLRSFQGYRLLQEYFALPQRFLFADVGGLAPIFARHAGDGLEIVLLFGRGHASLENAVHAQSLSLFSTPAVNLFPKRTSRIHVTDDSHEYHVVADRAAPMDFEIHTITQVTGYGTGSSGERTFRPFYAAHHLEDPDHSAYYSVRRELRRLSDSQKRTGFRSSYVGSEVFLSLVDQDEAPYAQDLRQIGVDTLCTNRDLILQMPIGTGATDFWLDTSAPLFAIRVIKGPSRPYSPLTESAIAWRFVSQLSLNYLSLLDTDPNKGAAALRELLELHATTSDPAFGKQVEGVRSIRTERAVRRLPLPGPIAFGRGLEIEIEVDEMAFQGGSAFLFGLVMDQFLRRHVSVNSFTATTLRSATRGEIMTWEPRCGERAIL